MNVQLPRKRLAIIRCLQDCISSFREGTKFTDCVCYVPSEVRYQCNSRCFLQVYAEPTENSKRIRDLAGTAESTICASGEEMCNSGGKWIKISKFKASEKDEEIRFDSNAWITLFSCKTPVDDLLNLTEIKVGHTLNHKVEVNKWQDVVVHHYCVDLRKKSVHIVPPDLDAVNKLQKVPLKWSIEHDEALVRLMCKHFSPENQQLGSIKNYVDSIDVSSLQYSDDSGALCLTDGDMSTYWESDGSQGQHWISLKMKKGTIIKTLQLGLDSTDDNYLPSKIEVMGGDTDNMKSLNSLSIDWDTQVSGFQHMTVLENITDHYPVILIKIKDSGGIDTRIRDLKIISTEERSLGFDLDFFKGENLCRFPILETYEPQELYYRSILLQRFLDLVDSVLQYIVPAWEYSIGSYSSLEFVRQLLPLSKKRLSLIETFLRESSSEPDDMPKLYINRRAAMEHKCDPSLDPEYKNTIFTQMYEGLKPKDRNSTPLNYRWSYRYEQWWECKFLSEGVIDQGGGFRDSLSDLAEELCPASGDGPVPTPFFIRSPNQFCDDSNINRDVYVPNPSCDEFAKYEWIGQIMGACLRGRDNLVIALPAFVWKKLVGERVSWTRDYTTVDSATVKMIDNLETISSSEFMGASRHWTCTLSDGSTTYIKLPDGEGNAVQLKYEDREQYCQHVRKIRMAESDEQINALRTGLLKVVPQAVLDLLTWQELEQRVSGNPEITLEALKRSTIYEDMEEEKAKRVKYMWEALKNFSNEDRSKFLRFITGRRRLPATIYISIGRGESIDCLPESSTCANTLYLPEYSCAKIAEEKIRYATYNCMDIDTDMHMMDE